MVSNQEKAQSQILAKLERSRNRITRLKGRMPNSRQKDGGGVTSFRDLSPGDHACCLHQNDGRSLAAVASFLSDGVERGDKLLYLPEKDSVLEAFDFLERENVPTDGPVSSGQLVVVDPAETSLSRRHSNPWEMLSLLQEERDKALRQGFAALRFICEMSWVLRLLPSSRELVEFEAEMSRFFSNSRAMGLCLYDMGCIRAEDLLEGLVAHPLVVVGGKCQGNIYYLPPEELTSSNRAEKELNRRLKVLETPHWNEETLRRETKSYCELFDYAPVGIFITDSEGGLCWLNSEMARILGAASPDEAMERYRELGHDLYMESERRLKFLDLLRRQGQVEHFEFEARHLEGGSVWLAMNARVRQWLPDGSFLIDGFVTDVTERRQSEKKIRHLNRVLSAIRNVNQLITTKRDRYQLVQGACDRLVESRAYNSAWIALFDGVAGRCGTCVEAGTGEGFRKLTEQLCSDDLPGCARYALECSDVAILRESDSVCSECHLGGIYSGSAGIAAPLVHQDVAFGVMVLCMSLSSKTEEKEGELVRELARDIAFALYKLDLEDDRSRAEKELQKSERFLRSTLDGLSAHIAVLNDQGEIVLVNKAWREFALANNGSVQEVSEGADYLAVCAGAEGGYAEAANTFAEEVRGIIQGRSDFFSLEYPCPSPEKERWFIVRVSPFSEDPPRRVVVSHEEITERKKAERALWQSEANYRDLFDNSPVGIHLSDSTGRLYYVNPAMASLLGAASQEDFLRHYTDFASQLYADPSRRQELIRKLLRDGKIDGFEFEARHLGGGTVWLSLHARISEWRADGEFLIDGFAVDVTERKRAEEALRRLTEEQGLLLESVPTQIWYLTEVDRYGAVNQAHADFYGLSRKEMEYRRLWNFLPQEEARICRDGNVQVFETGEQIRSEEWLRDGKGEMRLIEIIKTPKLGADGEVEYVVCAGSDITERKHMEERLREMSLYDPLTGLYNRSLFEEEIWRLQDERYCPMGIIVCDINGLKLINDTMGHTQGDNLLRTFADTLKRCFRGSDIMARIGGDEFAVLLPESSPETVRECSQRIRQGVSHHNAQNQNLELSVALGYAVESGPGLDTRELFKRADDVMYKEKLQQSYSSRSATVQALIKTLEARDFITDGHAGRLHNYAQKLGHSLGLSEERLNDLQILARFHDLGKVGIPDHILFKPDRLTEEEFEEMKRHCEIGHRIAMSTSDLAPVADYILKHHEWWDGRGYPLGIHGEEIPLECRIIALVDAYDAMTSERPYKRAMSHDQAVRELKCCAGTQFDPALVEEFIQIMGKSDG